MVHTQRSTTKEHHNNNNSLCSSILPFNLSSSSIAPQESLIKRETTLLLFTKGSPKLELLREGKNQLFISISSEEIQQQLDSLVYQRHNHNTTSSRSCSRRHHRRRGTPTFITTQAHILSSLPLH